MGCWKDHRSFLCGGEENRYDSKWLGKSQGGGHQMINLKAWAKINLGLKILNKRDDGFHDIETTLTTINLSDLLTLEEIDSGIQIITTGIDIKKEDNLCFRAADLYMSRYGIIKGVKITLTKNIPIGAGLGGGSSDAAAVLKGLAKLFEMYIEDPELMELAADIGSDVPFFVKGGAAYARGRGEVLKFFKLPRMQLVLYYPGYAISTSWAYEEHDKMLTPEPVVDNISAGKKKIRKGFALENHFEKIVFSKYPDLLDVKTHLLGTGAFLVSLSGSGSSVFAVVDDTTRARVINYLDGIGAQYFEVHTV
jgi:4-diphosphocytidyl-2-C-methyl-D-erythritol kinase